MKTILGIDPGATGALAWLSPVGIKQIVDMPTLRLTRNSRNRKEVDHVELARLLDVEPPDFVFVERVQAMPGQGVSSSFAFGRAAGIALGCAASTRASVYEISPMAWRRMVGLKTGAGKDAARALCKQTWPDISGIWARVKDDGRADATLIAMAGRQKLQKEGRL